MIENLEKIEVMPFDEFVLYIDSLTLGELRELLSHLSDGERISLVNDKIALLLETDVIDNEKEVELGDQEIEPESKPEQTNGQTSRRKFGR